MNTDTIDVESKVEAPPMALTTVDAVKALSPIPSPIAPQITAAQAKVEAVADLTKSAYARASELKLTPEEVKGLMAEFPDEAFKPGAAGKENLLYVEHAFLRDRLNSVFGPGQWSVIPRSRWEEPYDYYDKANRCTAKASRVYVEAMLLVRGCFVSEAIGNMDYYPKNQQTNYGDAVEGAKTAALRRCCKELGVGLQAWKRDWCEGWWQRKNGQGRSQQPQAPRTPTVAQKPPTEAPAAPNGSPGITSYPTVEVVTVREKKGVSASTNKPWTVWFIKFSDGFCELEAGTFDNKIADLANDLANTQEQGSLEVKPGRKANTLEIVSLVRASAAQAPSDEPPFNPNEETQEVTP